MSRPSRSLVVLFTLALVILACASPVPSAGSPTPNPPAAPDPKELGTVVASTLTALAPSALAPTAGSPTAPVVTAAPQGSTSVLPRAFYYLAPDNAGVMQVFRLEADGVYRRQLTSESVNVTDYDVSVMDGSIAYVSNNHLLMVSSVGSNRSVLVDGGAVDANNPFLNTLSSPVFSYDGKTLAYGYKGLQMYSFETGNSQMLIPNLVDDVGNGLFVPKELYSPEHYSFDGTKLLVTVSFYEGASSAIYYPATKALVRLDGAVAALICCDDVKWAYDSASLYAASPTLGMFNPGLWKVDAGTGKVTTLLNADAGGGNYNLADEAYLAPDNQLYYFFASAPSPEGMITRSPLQLVRSAADGVTGRAVLSDRDFELLNEALWADDASSVVVVMAPAREVYQGGQAEIIYLDGRPSLVLAPSAQQIKWGP